MPIYDYQCRRCGHRFEQLVKADESPACPACGASDPQRQFPSSAAVSTARTRGRALAEARGKASAVKREKDHAHAEYMRNEMKDHGG
ncbi:MAG TPA: zinc ribbon domain-containing protein [Steroidobacteraceae bacterium]|nr:zinc ribbon domain-containing protein [Steroidobacteraceae bacterium]